MTEQGQILKRNKNLEEISGGKENREARRGEGVLIKGEATRTRTRKQGSWGPRKK